MLRYLGSKYGEHLFPAEPAARAVIDQWMSWVQSSWSPAMTAAFVSHIRVERADRDPKAVAAQVARVHALATLVDGILGERRHLATDALSLADFTFGAFLYRYYTLEIDRPDLPRLQAYYDALCARPAYVEHVQIDYDGMRIKGAERPA
ncbi:MAG: glutathione binding-like protein [Burkholderiaceae bacterium]